MQSLAAFGALGPGETSWRVEGPGCPLGVVRIDSAGCSLCEVCVGVCPTGALKAERNSAGSVRLSFDSGRCTACAACVGSCPESVVTLERAADGGVLVQGRQVVATGPPVGCVRCGAPLAARPLPGALRRRLAGSHPTLGAETASICADCRLGGRSRRGRLQAGQIDRDVPGARPWAVSWRSPAGRSRRERPRSTHRTPTAAGKTTRGDCQGNDVENLLGCRARLQRPPGVGSDRAF